MPRLNRYPRGYVRQLEGTAIGSDAAGVTVNEVTSDPTIENLYKLYMGGSVNRNSWDFRALVIKRCAQLLGGFRQWLFLQITANDCIYDLNLKFLEDTLLFIRTGRRDMAIENWIELLLEHPEENHGVASMARAGSFNLRDPKEFDNVIGQWCAHPGGFDDMLCTAHVLFGVSKKPMFVAPNTV